MEIVLYRGIAVRPEAASDIAKSIMDRGFDGAEGLMKFRVPADIASAQKSSPNFVDEPSSFENLWDGPTVAGICACGSKDGAAFYASQHNIDRGGGKTLPLLVAFRTSLDRIYIDCRDFLMAAFQGFDRVSYSHLQNQRAVLSEIFGEAILLYFDRCSKTNNHAERIALGNMATFDSSAIQSHLANPKWLLGRYKTRFKSAFFVSAPIEASDILGVEVVTSNSTNSRAYSLDDFFHGTPL